MQLASLLVRRPFATTLVISVVFLLLGVIGFLLKPPDLSDPSAGVEARGTPIAAASVTERALEEAVTEGRLIRIREWLQQLSEREADSGSCSEHNDSHTCATGDYVVEWFPLDTMVENLPKKSRLQPSCFAGRKFKFDSDAGPAPGSCGRRAALGLRVTQRMRLPSEGGIFRVVCGDWGRLYIDGKLILNETAETSANAKELFVLIEPGNFRSLASLESGILLNVTYEYAQLRGRVYAAIELIPASERARQCLAITSDYAFGVVFRVRATDASAVDGKALSEEQMQHICDVEAALRGHKFSNASHTFERLCDTRGDPGGLQLSCLPSRSVPGYAALKAGKSCGDPDSRAWLNGLLNECAPGYYDDGVLQQCLWGATMTFDACIGIAEIAAVSADPAIRVQSEGSGASAATHASKVRFMDEVDVASLQPRKLHILRAPSGVAKCSDGSDFFVGIFLEKDANGQPELRRFAIEFMGGGACFDQPTCATMGKSIPEMLQSGESRPSYVDELASWVHVMTEIVGNGTCGTGMGLSDMCEPRNPVRGRTLVYVPYCTGDVHVGHNEYNYGGARIHHSGASNVVYVLDWLEKNFPDLDNIFAFGGSAGAFATYLWSPHLAARYPRAVVRAFADSGMHVPAPSTEASKWWTQAFGGACWKVNNNLTHFDGLALNEDYSDYIAAALRHFRGRLQLAVFTCDGDKSADMWWEYLQDVYHLPPKPRVPLVWNMLRKINESVPPGSFASYVIPGYCHHPSSSGEIFEFFDSDTQPQPVQWLQMFLDGNLSSSKLHIWCNEPGTESRSGDCPKQPSRESLVQIPASTIPMLSSRLTQSQQSVASFPSATVASCTQALLSWPQSCCKEVLMLVDMFQSVLGKGFSKHGVLKEGSETGDDWLVMTLLPVRPQKVNQEDQAARRESEQMQLELFEIVKSHKEQLTGREVEIVGVKVNWHVKATLWSRTMLRELFLAILAFAFIFVLMWIHTGSLFLTSFAYLQIILSLGCGYTIYAALQIPLFSFLNPVCIFMVIGIGADDVFVLVDAWKQSFAELPITTGLEERIASTLSRSARSMFITSFTTAFAMLANLVSAIPAIRLFGFFTAVVVLCDYFLMITLTLSLLVVAATVPCVARCPFVRCNLFGPLQEHNANPTAVSPTNDDPTAVSPTNDDDGGGEDVRYVAHRWAERACGGRVALCVIRGRWVFALSLLSLAVVCAWYGTQIPMPEAEKLQVFIDSHLMEQYDMIQRLQFASAADLQTLEVKYPLRILFGLLAEDKGNHLLHFRPSEVHPLTFASFTLAAPDSQQYLLDLCDDLLEQPFVLPPSAPEGRAECFIQDFRAYLAELDCGAAGVETACCKPSGGAKSLPMPQMDFELCFHHFAQSANPEVVVDPNTGIPRAAMLRFTLRAGWTQSYTKAGAAFSAVSEWLQPRFAAAPVGMKGGFWSTWSGLYDLQDALARGAAASTALAMVFAFAVMLVVCGNIIITFYAILTIACIIICMAAAVQLMGWELGLTESVIFSMATGMAVDFTVHFGHAYTCTPDTDRSDRTRCVTFSLKRMGITLTMAALTTAVAGAVMMPSTVIIFVRFGLFLLLSMIFSWLYSFFFFQSLCAIAGPTGEAGEIRPFISKCIRRLEPLVRKCCGRQTSV